MTVRAVCSRIVSPDVEHAVSEDRLGVYGSAPGLSLVVSGSVTTCSSVEIVPFVHMEV